ncbi:sulfatase family protein [Lignipirellula cremea]|nr:sulfatase [Lignipirellula cremea]
MKRPTSCARLQATKSLPTALLAAVLFLLAICLPDALRKVQAEERPNILFFLSDDQRSDLLGCAGHAILKTPHIDALAKKGVRFDNMFVTTSICAASRATLLTGLYERTHRFTFGTPPIDPTYVKESYPAVLRRAGYRTGFVGKFGVSAAGGGPKEMFDFFKPLNRSPYFKKMPDGSERHVSEIAGDHAIAFLQSGDGKQPYCLSVSFNAPHAEDGDKENHYPWPHAVDGLYDDIEVPAPHLSEPAVFDSQPEFLRKSMNRDRWYWRWDTPEKYQKNIRAYYRMISGVDHVIGRVLAKVEELGQTANTVVIFSGDNGYYAGSRGFAGKWSHYEESLRVPLVIYDPRQQDVKLPSAQATATGRVLSPIVLNVDIPPTILALAGVAAPARYEGRSLLPWLEGEAPSDWRTDFFCEHLFNNRSIPKWEGVRDQRYVYARYFEQEPPFEFLHDLQADPQQLQNLVEQKEYAKVLTQLCSRCDELRETYDKARVVRP